MDPLEALRRVMTYLVNNPEPGVLARGPDGEIYRVHLTKLSREEFEEIRRTGGVLDVTPMLGRTTDPSQN